MGLYRLRWKSCRSHRRVHPSPTEVSRDVSLLYFCPHSPAMRDQWGRSQEPPSPGRRVAVRGTTVCQAAQGRSPGCARLTGSDLPDKAEHQSCRRGCWYRFQSGFSAGSWEPLLPAVNGTSFFCCSTGRSGAALRLSAWCCGHQVPGSSQ